MAIFFPDVSHYDRDAGRNIPADAQIVIAKSTHGTRFVDSAYQYWKGVAQSRGIYFTAYHWLNHLNGAQQAQYCYANVGNIPVMVDAEDVSGNTGYNGVLSVTDIVNFVVELRRLGGTCRLIYLPHWYWQSNMGSPSLQPLADLGCYLVSSNYRTYSDTGAGWTGYGGMSVAQWQYTSTPMDMNAFRGTVADYRALIEGDTVALAQDEHDALMELLNRMRWVDPRVAALLDMTPTYTDQAGKSHPAVAVKALSGIGQPTDAQLQAQATTIANALVASNSNGLTQADHAGVVADVKQALREGVAAA